MSITRMRLAKLASLLCFGAMAVFSPTKPAMAAHVVGYWVDDGSLDLPNVSTNYDVVIISAGELSGTDNATVSLDTGAYTQDQLISGIQTLQSQGQTVEFCFYSGGPTLQLLNQSDVQALETSLEAIVDTYGFNGIDFDLEDGTLAPGPGDNNIYHPDLNLSPTLVNMIQVAHDLKSHYGSSFWITTPPESEGVNSYSFWGNDIHSGWVSSWGDDVPFLVGIKDVLTFASLQEYLNLSAPYYGLDGNIYSPAGNAADFWASQGELMIDGYTLSTGENFAGLDPSQVVIGVGVYEGDPAGPLLAAVQYLGSGTPDGGAYVLRHPEGYPTFGGVMDWDINTDSGATWASTLAPYLHSIPNYPASSTVPATPANLTATPNHEVTNLSWAYGTGATSYTVYRGTDPAGSDQTPVASGISPDFYNDSDLTAGTAYYYAVSAVNSNGTSSPTSLVAGQFTLETPYNATPSAVPGVVEADNYDLQSGLGYQSTSTNTGDLYRPDGVTLESCSDTDGNGNGYDVTNTTPGNWLRYTINATTAGQYTFSIRVASAAGGTFHLQDTNGVPITGPITIPATGGGQAWTTVTATQIQPSPNAWLWDIPAGQSIIELVEDTGGFSVEYMNITLQTPDQPTILYALGGSTVSLYWLPDGGQGNLNDGATFNVYRGTTSGGEDYNHPIATGITASIINQDVQYTDDAVTSGVNYYYTVAGVNSAGTSLPSGEVSAEAISFAGVYAIVSDESGYALDDPSNVSGVGADQQPYTGGSQIWNVTPVGGGNYEITNQATGLALTGADPFGQLTLAPYTGNSDQMWTIMPNFYGPDFVVINVWTGLAMDNFGGGQGVPVGQWYNYYGGDYNQVWAIAAVPTISTISPSSAAAGSSAVLTITGQDFEKACSVLVNGTSYKVDRVSSTSLIFTMPASKMDKAHVLQVQVLNPDGGLSNAVPFTVYNVPVIAGLTPDSASEGPQPTITISGQYFDANCVVLVNGTSYHATQVNSGDVTFVMPSSKMDKAHVLTVQVENPDTGAISNGSTFTVTP